MTSVKYIKQRDLSPLCKGKFQWMVLIKKWSGNVFHKLRYVSTTHYLITIKVSHRQHVSTNQVVIIRSIT